MKDISMLQSGKNIEKHESDKIYIQNIYNQ